MNSTSSSLKKVVIVAEGTHSNSSTARNLNKLIAELDAVAKVSYVFSFCRSSDIVGVNTERLLTISSCCGGIKKFFANQIKLPIKLSSKSVRDNCDIILFSFGEDLQILSIILYKIYGKKIFIRSDGRPSVHIKYYRPNSFFLRAVYCFIESISYRLSDQVLTECDSMIKEYHFPSNTAVLKLYVDTNKYCIKKPILQRKHDIGYVGRFECEKGVLNFLDSISLLPSTINIIMVGDGSLRSDVELRVQSLRSLGYDIELVNWVSNGRLPDYLNEIKILVMPSNKEGLPNTLLEAMACGTAVIATDVGGIPGILSKSNGLIIGSNAPSVIADAILSLLDGVQLKSMSRNANKYIVEHFAFPAVLEEVKRII